MEYTVITKGNEVRQYNSIDGVNRDIKHSCIVVNKIGTIIERSSGASGNPITWPTDAKNGLQAIVDVKEGTLRFAYDGWPRAQTEFVVSEYVEPFVSVEDSAPVHVLDLIKEWPSAANSPAALPDLPGFKWMFHDGGVWSICGMNGDTEFFEGHWLNYHENKKKYANDHCGDEGIELTYSNPVTAASILTAALGHMEDRAKTYDAPGGERSMGKTVAAFNVITGHTLTEEAGWLFMEILKQVRSQQGDYRADNYEDMVAYAALRGECAARERGNES